MSFFEVAVQVWPMLMKGLVVTVEVTVLSLAIAAVLGMTSCLMGMSAIKPVSWLSKFYVWIIRGTPFIVQLFIIYFGIPQFLSQMGFDIRFTSFQAAAATLALNAGAYMSEIFRGGVQAVDKGQMEAARSLGLPKSRSMVKIILPQALRISIPALGNQCIITLKDSSLAQTIALAEIVYMGKIFVGRTMQSFYTYLLIGVVYLVIITVLQVILARIERRMDHDK
ncbi:MAG: amino acid ABC transporter permease [Anaerovoracaceae bacterium]|nr:amino acid ABC transporter permease [Bacillota bacterium]MDY3954719.1 amino acid ABC transporter permease [Anaerovoracaceae bacterium]